VIAELSLIQAADYLVVGVAACRRRNSEGKAEDIWVFEPIPATALEAMVRELKTSFVALMAVPYGDVLVDGDVLVPEALWRPELQIGEDFVFRATAAARTFKAKPHLQLVPLDVLCTPETATPLKLHYADELKRILGAKREISESDNVKQHSHTHKVL